MANKQTLNKTCFLTFIGFVNGSSKVFSTNLGLYVTNNFNVVFKPKWLISRNKWGWAVPSSEQFNRVWLSLLLIIKQPIGPNLGKASKHQTGWILDFFLSTFGWPLPNLKHFMLSNALKKSVWKQFLTLDLIFFKPSLNWGWSYLWNKVWNWQYTWTKGHMALVCLLIKTQTFTTNKN